MSNSDTSFHGHIPVKPSASEAQTIGEVKMILIQLQNSMARVESGLFGDKQLGHKGLVKRVEEAETILASHDRKIFLWSTVAAGIGAFAMWAKDNLTLKF